MLVRAFWPKWSCDEVDGFWVEATLAEAETQVFCLLLPESVIRSRALAEQYRAIAEDLADVGQPPRPYCFLVSRNLESVEPFHVHYPFHQLWNAYSPFGQFADHHIESLSELAGIQPHDVVWLGIHTPEDSSGNHV